MKWLRGAVVSAVLLVLGAALTSGGSEADSIRQRYLPADNTLKTVARFGTERIVTVHSLGDPDIVRSDPDWLALARPLGPRAPRWARRMYARSLLVLHALTNARTGAVLAGAREGWAYVWPRDASAAAIALAAAGYRRDARHVVRFLRDLDLSATARFHGDGTPVAGRAAQGDAAGWVAAATRAAGLGGAIDTQPWRGRADYHEGDTGDYVANAVASTAARPKGNPPGERPALRLAAPEIRELFGTPTGVLTREAHDDGSGIDSAVAWAVRPFPLPSLFPLVRRSLLRLAFGSTPYGILPSENWEGGEDPWTAPTAWAAWSLAALGERPAALRLMAELRHAATPDGMLPERVDLHTGIPTSTTPLAWSHAFAILALRQLWPGPPHGRSGQSDNPNDV
jgi:glucoamylase